MWERLRRRRPEARRAPEVVVVTRTGCHLCEEMLAMVGAELGPEARPGTLDLDAALAAGQITAEQHKRWTTLVPVLLVDGREVAHYRVQPGQVAALRDRSAGGPESRRSRRFGG
ncbi:glutaredoxin family protein [Ornithinimicrobium pratense]|uniref:Glutaredoxin family protein n=1 Tax=Ornithinimicrobium pratense TaxID=2593973 RepID=A0A5J6V1Y1_9MICO|nr:glutaredoxin family protein [Ornithinimicrobium pratense]QFG67647.1 glutaredoxin family protein [Ornithinimicrobium pratense]